MTNVSTHNKNKDNENFPVGSSLIRADLRPHIHCFYNFARAADDISDDPLMDPSRKVMKLDRFAVCLTNTDQQDIPEAVAMRQSLKDTDITPGHCLDLITAFKRDATKLRYANWDELLDYCRYSASPVGRYVLALHGIGETAWPANDALCTALQIINHVQDCADDYRELDRVYLPADILTAHNASPSMLSNAESPAELRAAMAEVVDKTNALMPLARTLPRHVPDLRLKLETAVIAGLADTMIGVLRKRDPLRENAKLNKGEKIRAVLHGVLRAWL